ncbi:MAG TPA: YeeE/YedE family protein [Verrucomicrobiae bacterium]|jgi:uncharacterized protein|nr:YeeE/YedE family protein [Verrucomicrobiae bacterium]
MRTNLSALAAGLLFGLGLTISGMINPAKVLGFLDIAGDWDPSLLFVLGGAVVAATIGFRLVQRRQAPLFASRFHLPEASGIDIQLILGAALFGTGWGLVGFCPGPAIAALLADGWQVALFVTAALLGMAAQRLFRGPQSSGSAQALTRH